VERRDFVRGALTASVLGVPQLRDQTAPAADIFIERAVSGTPHQGKVLALITPHLDDGPFFASGTVAKLLQRAIPDTSSGPATTKRIPTTSLWVKPCSPTSKTLGLS